MPPLPRSTPHGPDQRSGCWREHRGAHGARRPLDSGCCNALPAPGERPDARSRRPTVRAGRTDVSNRIMTFRPASPPRRSLRSGGHGPNSRPGGKSSTGVLASTARPKCQSPRPPLGFTSPTHREKPQGDLAFLAFHKNSESPSRAAVGHIDAQTRVVLFRVARPTSALGRLPGRPQCGLDDRRRSLLSRQPGTGRSASPDRKPRRSRGRQPRTTTSRD